ncbi:MAG: nucleotidyltransferase domain-containing protein [Actinomycetota bacterium]|nr:nucleotidyltransferase domain-containing protein [Actinomycetota bacterium]
MAMTAYLDIGFELVRTRRAQGMSQRRLGELLGVRQQQVARWEATGYGTASLERVVAAAGALGLEHLSHYHPVVAEMGTPYSTSAASPTAAAASSVRDLGQVVARLRDHGDRLREEYHLDRIGVFGSFATGEQTQASDIDLLVESADPGGLRFIAAAGFAEEVLGRKVDFVRPNTLGERLRDRVLGEVVYVWTA